jgi:hypothetical protein
MVVKSKRESCADGLVPLTCRVESRRNCPGRRKFLRKSPRIKLASSLTTPSRSLSRLTAPPSISAKKTIYFNFSTTGEGASIIYILYLFPPPHVVWSVCRHPASARQHQALADMVVGSKRRSCAAVPQPWTCRNESRRNSQRPGRFLRNSPAHTG